MNKTLQDRRVSLFLVVVCFAAYTLIGFSRSAYTAALAGIIDDGVFTKTAAGTINSSFYITYSLAQIFGSFYVDRFSPFKIISLGILGTILANVVMWLYPSFWVILLARSFSGLVQFGVWPAFLKIITEYIQPEHRGKSKFILPQGISTGSILSFLVAAIVLRVGTWKDLFTVTFVALGIVLVFFWVAVTMAQRRAVPVAAQKESKLPAASEQNRKKGENWKLIASSGALLFFISSFMSSIFGNGTGSWMPTLIMESYDLSPSFSSVLSTLATCSNLVGIFWVMVLYPKRVKNEAAAVGVYFLMILPLVVTMIFVGRIPLILTVALIVFSNMFRSAIHHFYTVEIPAKYQKYNKAGMMAGLINVAACLGSMTAGTVYGYTADNFGWSKTIMLWAIFVFIGMMASFCAAPVWKKFAKRK